MAKPRTVFKLESKYFQFLTDRELEILRNDKNCNKHLTYKEDMTLIGAIANTILDGRTVEGFINELESKLAAFNAKYSCDKSLSVRVDEDRLFIKFAYNEQLKNELKKSLSAKWHADSKEWSISLADEVAANEIVKKHLGKGFLKEEAAEVESKKEEKAEPKENNTYTCEELASRYSKVFLVDPYHIIHLLGLKYHDCVKCVVDNRRATIHEIGDIALLDFPDCLLPDNAKAFVKPKFELNDSYNKKALALSVAGKESEIGKLLEDYIEELKKLQK